MKALAIKNQFAKLPTAARVAIILVATLVAVAVVFVAYVFLAAIAAAAVLFGGFRPMR